MTNELTAPVPAGIPLGDGPFTLLLHLVSGANIRLPVETFDIVPPSMTEEGIEVPMRLDYTPVEGWDRILGFLDFRGVIAIEIVRGVDVGA